MRLWELGTQGDDYANFLFCNEKDWDISDLFNGSNKNLLENWKPIDVKISASRKKGDAPDLFCAVPVFSKKAVEALAGILNENVELLPLAKHGEGYFMVNVITLISNALDMNCSDLLKYNDDIYGYNKLAFKYDVVKDINIFKVFEFPQAPVIVSDAFKDRVHENNLLGFRFVELWDSERD